LQAIWRAAAANPAPRRIRPTLPSAPMTASRPIVGKPDSYALRAEADQAPRCRAANGVRGRELARDSIFAAQIIWRMYWPHREQAPSHTVCFDASASAAQDMHYRIYRGRIAALAHLSRSHRRITASAEGVGALLAGDLARSGSKPGALVDQTSTTLRPHDRFAAHRRQAGLLRPPGRSRPGAELSRRKRSPWEGACSRFDIRRPDNMANVPASSRASSLPQGLFRRRRICGARDALPQLSRSHRRITASAEGVGALLAGDLARSGSKPGVSVDQTSTTLTPHDRFAAHRRQAGLPRSSGRSRPGAAVAC